MTWCVVMFATPFVDGISFSCLRILSLMAYPLVDDVSFLCLRQLRIFSLMAYAACDDDVDVVCQCCNEIPSPPLFGVWCVWVFIFSSVKFQVLVYHVVLCAFW